MSTPNRRAARARAARKVPKLKGRLRVEAVILTSSPSGSPHHSTIPAPRNASPLEFGAWLARAFPGDAERVVDGIAAARAERKAAQSGIEATLNGARVVVYREATIAGNVSGGP